MLTAPARLAEIFKASKPAVRFITDSWAATSTVAPSRILVSAAPFVSPAISLKGHAVILKKVALARTESMDRRKSKSRKCVGSASITQQFFDPFR